MKRQRPEPNDFQIPCSHGCGRTAAGHLSLNFTRYVTAENKNRRDWPAYDASIHVSYPICEACLKKTVTVLVRVEKPAGAES